MDPVSKDARDATGEHARLTRSGPCDDDEWAVVIEDGLSLGRIEVRCELFSSQLRIGARRILVTAEIVFPREHRRAKSGASFSWRIGDREERRPAHSHSIVPGGLEVMS